MFTTKNTCVSHDWIVALTFGIHSCSHYMASNMKPMVDSGAAIHACSTWFGFSPLHPYVKQFSLKGAGGNVLHHLGELLLSKSQKFTVNYEVAPVVRPILSVDVLTSKGMLVVFGVVVNSSLIQLPDGHRNSNDQRKWRHGVQRHVG